MPLVRIEIIKGQSREYKAAVLQAVHEGLVSALGIPEDDRYQRLYELDAADFECAGKTEKFCMVELTLYPGRSREMKRAAIVEITRLLGERCGVPKDDVFININEPPLDNWGFGGEMASDLALEYKK